MAPVSHDLGKNRRITFLISIAATITSMVLFSEATSGEGSAARLAVIAQHATVGRITPLLDLLQGFVALAPAVRLCALTREQDTDVARLAPTCRVAEGIGVGVATTLGPGGSPFNPPFGSDGLSCGDSGLQVQGWS